MPRVRDVLYVRFKVSDLQAQKAFLDDFGLHTEILDNLLLARGTDSSPYVYLAEESTEPGLESVGFVAESEAALREIAAIDGVAVESNPLVGGGLIARLEDPNGFSIEIVAEQSAADLFPVVARAGFNSGTEKQRLGERVSFARADCLVKRLGHVVLMVKDFRDTFEWYQRRLGLIISYEIVMHEDGQEQTLGAFTRCNLVHAAI